MHAVHTRQGIQFWRARNHAQTKRHRVAGVTIIELMVAVVVLSVLLTIAAPNLQSFMTNIRLTSAINDMATDIALARSEASSRGVRVVVCPATSNSACSSTQSSWSTGRMVFVDANANGAFDSGETRIKYLDGISSLAIAVSDASSNPLSLLTFSSFGGLVGGVTANIKLCSTSGSATNGRQLVISPTGRTVVTKITNCP